MRFELYKILDKQYVNDFIHGDLFMNTLSYFRRIEKNCAQGDQLEGVCGSIRKDQLKQLGIYFDKGVQNAIQGNVSLVNDYYGYNNVLCLYRFIIDDDNRCVSVPAEELRQFNDEDAASKVVLRVKDTDLFLKQIAEAVEKGLQEHKLEYGVYGKVVYERSWLHADGPGTRSAFHKEPEYEYQNEWRLCILRRDLIDRPYKLNIGDITDIVEIIPLEQFLKHPEKPYPGYTAINKKLMLEGDGYRIFGTLNAVSHLMYSYTPKSGETPIRSDEAQADWYYTKYLELTDSTKDIDPYLDMRMRAVKDLDHLELLVNYRLSVGAWGKATDAYMFFINENPVVIEENPDKFFFPLHSIFMQHQEAADAGKLLETMANKYELSDGIKQVMRGDILFALGFYDQVLPIFEKMKKDSRDPILDYYLAVCNLHVLNFDKANQHLSEYEKYFSHSPEAAQRAEHLRNLIDCFGKCEMLKIDSVRHGFEELTWNDKTEEILKNTQKDKLYCGLDILYLLERERKWQLIERFEMITICPMTIARIIDLYLQTGDVVFFDLIEKLEKLKYVKIRSPKLEYYLAIDTMYRDMLPYIKMEQALLVQESQS